MIRGARQSAGRLCRGSLWPRCEIAPRSASTVEQPCSHRFEPTRARAPPTPVPV